MWSRRCLCVFSSLLLIFPWRALSGSDCDFGMVKLWTSKLKDTPLTATPLLFDVDGDGFDDILAASFSGEVWGVHGENGHIVDNWPFYLEDRAFHAGPLVYDINQDGLLEFVLTTTDAEIVFVQTDNKLLHGETIKIPPLRVKRHWHQEDPALIKQEAMVGVVNKDAAPPPTARRSNFTTSFSEFDSRFGRHADPLYSRHETTPRPSGVDLRDPQFVFVDPHVLATPIIADIDGTGLFDLVVSVSYYFDPYRYGDSHHMNALNGLEAGDLEDYAAGGVVIIDLHTGKVKGQKLLGITRVTDNQPGYLLATPTVVRLKEGEEHVIIIGTAMGELHVLSARTLEDIKGFPLMLDSMTSSVAVGEVFGSGSLDLLVGDSSGIVYCITRQGERVWERELDEAITASIRLADLEGDGVVEVVVVTRGGDVWVLNGQTGLDHTSSVFPVHLNSDVETSPLIMHMKTRAGAYTDGRNHTLGIVVPTKDAIFIVDAITGCVNHVRASDHMIYEVMSGDIDPYHPGLELLAVGLDGTLVCFKSTFQKWEEQEAWSGDALGQSIFTHKENSFYFSLPFANTSQEVTGKFFKLPLRLYCANYRSHTQLSITVTIGQKYTLLQDSIDINQRVTEVELSVPSPPIPLYAFVTVRVCNKFKQCRSQSLNTRFNLHFEDNLKWFLCLPFLSLCALVLWYHRDDDFQMLPTLSSSRKDM